MSSVIKTIGKIRISEHVRSGKKTGQWRVNIPHIVSLNGSRNRKFFSSLEEAEIFAYDYIKTCNYAQSSKSNERKSELTLNEFLNIWIDEQERSIKLKRKRENSVKKDLGYTPITELTGNFLGL